VSELDDGIRLAQANERLRQEAAAFQAHLDQYHLWMRARRALLWVGIALLPAMMVISVLVLFYHDKFPAAAVTAASGALFVDALGIIGAVWKGIMTLDPPAAPAPITGQDSTAESNETSAAVKAVLPPSSAQGPAIADPAEVTDQAVGGEQAAPKEQ
jgi:hypothetical protein